MVKQVALFIAGDTSHLAPATHQAVVHAAFAMRYDIDVHGDGDRRTALVLEAIREFLHLGLVTELGCRRVLPPDFGPFAGGENIADSPVRDHHGVGSPGGQRRLLFPVENEAVLASRYGKIEGLWQRIAEKGDRGVNRGDVVEEEVWANDQVVEPAAVGPQRWLMVRALVQVIPRDGHQLFLSRVGNVQDYD